MAKARFGGNGRAGLSGYRVGPPTGRELAPGQPWVRIPSPTGALRSSLSRSGSAPICSASKNRRAKCSPSAASATAPSRLPARASRP